MYQSYCGEGRGRVHWDEHVCSWLLISNNLCRVPNNRMLQFRGNGKRAWCFFHFWTLSRRHSILTPPTHLLDWLDSAKENLPHQFFSPSHQDQYVLDLVSVTLGYLWPNSVTPPLLCVLWSVPVRGPAGSAPSLQPGLDFWPPQPPSPWGPPGEHETPAAWNRSRLPTLLAMWLHHTLWGGKPSRQNMHALCRLINYVNINICSVFQTILAVGSGSACLI